MSLVRFALKNAVRFRYYSYLLLIYILDEQLIDSKYNSTAAMLNELCTPNSVI